MADTNKELPSVNPDFEKMEEGELAVAGIQLLNEIALNIYLESEELSVNNAVGETAETIPALAAVSALNSAKGEDKLIEDLDRSLLAGDAVCDAIDSGSVSEVLTVGLELPQKVENPNIKSLVDVGERDMMGELGLVRREDGERIERAREERTEAAKLLDKQNK